eukprot:gene4003-7259_t
MSSCIFKILYKNVYFIFEFPNLNEQLHKFEILLSIKTNLRIFIQRAGKKLEDEEKSAWISVGQNVSDVIDISSDFFASALNVASFEITRSAKNTTKKIKENISECDTPIEVNESLKTTIEAGEALSHSLNSFTDKMHDTIVSNSASTISNIIKPIKKSLSDESPSSDTESAEGLEILKKIVKSTASGMSRISKSKEKLANSFADSLSDATVDIMTFKYGEEVGDLTKKSSTIVRESVDAYLKIKAFNGKNIMKDALKDSFTVRSKL